MSAFFEKLSSLAWGGGLVVFLLGAGSLFTVRLGFIQFRLPYLLRKCRGECAKNSGT